MKENKYATSKHGLNTFKTPYYKSFGNKKNSQYFFVHTFYMGSIDYPQSIDLGQRSTWSSSKILRDNYFHGQTDRQGKSISEVLLKFEKFFLFLFVSLPLALPGLPSLRVSLFAVSVGLSCPCRGHISGLCWPC